MGCWNGTCGFTNLPILSGEDVVLLLLARDKFFKADNPNDNRCYANSWWEVLGFPVYAKYNDYGWIEDVQENALSLWNLQMLDKLLIEREVGENPYHYLAVKRGEMSYEYLGDLLHDDRLWIKNAVRMVGNDDYRPVHFMMVRRDIYDAMIDTMTYEDWIDGKPHQRNAKDIEAKIRRDIEACDESKKESPDIGFMADYRLAGKYRDHLDLFDFLEEGRDYEDSELFIREFSRFYTFDICMQSMRKHYHPQSGSGSQDDNWVYYERLIDAMKVAIHNGKNRWGDYDDEDEDYEVDAAQDGGEVQAEIASIEVEQA